MPGGDPPSASQRSPGNRNPASNLFSLELMQTDDVSTIAAQIANQAELIYQAWKTTDLHPSDLIRYHSVSPDRGSPLASQNAFVNNHIDGHPTSVNHRIPIRSISPAPLGASPAIPRKVIEIPIATEPPVNINHSQNSPKHQYDNSNQYQQFAPQSSSQFPQQPKQQFQQNHTTDSPPQHSPLSRTLNASPRPYVPPASSEITQSSPQSPRTFNTTSPVDKLPGFRLFPSRNGNGQPPPPPPERSSSYVEPQPQTQKPRERIIPNPDLEASLRELVTNFVLEDKARLSNVKTTDHQKAVASSSIQDALNRFERQMAITSRVNDFFQTSDSFGIPSHSATIHNSALQTVPSPYSPKEYQVSIDASPRRSMSPSPALSNPGWNEFPSPATSTWPLKNKQPSNVDRNLVNGELKPKNITNKSSLASSVSQPINFITTLETQVDSQGRSPGMLVRHKVITIPELNNEENRLLESLKSPGGSTSFSSDNIQNMSPSHSMCNSNSNTISNENSASKPRKYTISVTVDVENKRNSPNAVLLNESTNSKQWPSSNHPDSLSTVDFAKVRFADAQQKPKTSQRLEDYKSYTTKLASNSDGRVMMAKSRFEGCELSVPEVHWRSYVETGSSLPEFYRRKVRKIRKIASPEPLHALVALPHPELTDQQKAHIRERSQSPTVPFGGSTAIRPHLSPGSVAERVLLFEKVPVDLKRSTTTVCTEKRPAFSTWRDPDEVQTKAQEIVSSPNASRSLDVYPHSGSHSPSQTTISTKPSPVPDCLSTGPENKENARPLPSSANHSHEMGPSIAPHSSTVPNNVMSSSMGTPSLGLGSSGLPAPVAPRVPGRRLPKMPQSLHIPRFYYPLGRPLPPNSQEQLLQRVSQCFKENGGQIQRDNMGPLLRACQVPLYWKAPLFQAAGGEKLGHITEEQFVDYWGRLISSCHDAASRFVRILSRGLRNYLLPEDFFFLVQDVVDTHPGLTFLKEATEFHSRYVHTVIARVYYCVNRSWSGKITIPELRRSNLLQVISYLEEEEDINKITDYFSYEHFYVIYCKFWELDSDHDLFIDRNDLAKHNDRALSDKIIDRIFSGAVTRGSSRKQDHRMGYQEFVWFLISEEDKKHPTAIEYWFRCMDLDGDGFLSMYELEYFYEDQLMRMESLGIETLPFTDCLCQMLDMVRPKVPGMISLSDMKCCRMTPIFFDTFFNFDKYLDHEQRDPFASHRMDDEGPEISDWDRYAAVEYELLVAEEGGGGDCQEDMYYDEDEDEISMGVDRALEGSEEEGDLDGPMDSNVGLIGVGSTLKKHANLSATVPNLTIDQMDVDEDYSDYADSDDYQY